MENIEKWAKKWEKCKVMHFGKNNPRYEYFLNNEKIPEGEEEKDLGVWVDVSLKPSKQCEKAAQSANFALGQISRTFHYRNKKNLIPLYKAFVRPKLEYAVQAWNPWLLKDITTLEKVQERMIRMLSDAKGGTYEEKLQDAGLTTLKDRRERGDMIEVFKTIKGINNVDKEVWFKIRDPAQTRATRGSTSENDGQVTARDDFLFMDNVRLDTRKNSFTVRIIGNWNKIPQEIRNKTTVNAFKNAYDKWKGTTNSRTT
jgi:ribonuclease P/MRP protein subunit RPP40